MFDPLCALRMELGFFKRSKKFFIWTGSGKYAVDDPGQ